MDRFPARQVDLSEVMAELFKSLAHSVRVRVLELLAAAEGTVPVSDLLASTGMEASHLSQHLSVLRRRHLVRSTRRGSQVFYELPSPHVPDLLAAARELLLNGPADQPGASGMVPGSDRTGTAVTGGRQRRLKTAQRPVTRSCGRSPDGSRNLTRQMRSAIPRIRAAGLP